MIRLLTISAAPPRKHIQWCIAVAKKLNKENYPFHWRFIGMNERLRSEISGIENCTARPHVDDTTSAYQEADLFVLPSELEGFGVVFLESLLCGTPVLCKEGGGADEIVKTIGGGGLIVNMNNYYDVEKAIKLYDSEYVRQGKTLMNKQILTNLSTIFDRQQLGTRWYEAVYGESKDV